MVLAIDLGTTTCKAAVFDEKGKLVELSKVPLDIVDDEKGALGADPHQWSRALKLLCSQLVNVSEVRAVVVSGNGPTVVPVFDTPRIEDSLLHAESGQARLWLDRRAVVEAQEISQYLGQFVDASFVLPQVLHMVRNDYSTYKRSLWFLSSFEFINYLLTGEARTILHAADATRWYWTETLLNQFSLNTDKFPSFCSPGEQIGAVTSLAAKALGLPQGVPVIASGPDFFVSILGCAVTKPGLVCDRLGTSEGINLCTDAPLTDNRLMTYLHPVTPYYNVSGIMSTTGKAISWAKDLLGLQDVSFEAMYDLIHKVSPGSDGLIFLPYLQGERAPIWNPYARGVFSGLSLTTEKGHILRAVAEGACFAARSVIAVMEESGGTVNALRVTGGPSESTVLNQLKADITGVPVSVPEVSDAELVGDMVIARTSLGDYSSFAHAAEDLVQMKTCFEPNPRLAALYTERFGQFIYTYEQLKESWRGGANEFRS